MRFTVGAERFRRDESGAALVYVLVALPVLVGILGLSVDLQRALTLNTELQSTADAAALAGAWELDGKDDAITRATKAAMNVVSNSPRAGSDDAPAVDIASTVFFERSGNGCGAVTTDPTLASCIKAITEPREAPSAFIQAVANLGDGTAILDLSTRAAATARARTVACAVTPMMMCLPEDDTIFQEGYMFALKDKGAGGGQLGPGVFSLLDPPNKTSSGAGETADLIASASPGFCYFQSASVATGNRTGPIADGLNVRFDIYGDKKLEDYPPAPNVTKGYVYKSGKICQANQMDEATAATELMAFPLDECFASGTCTTFGENRIGDGNWDRTGYFSRNHATHSASWPSDISTITRYKTYLWELGLDSIDDDTPGTVRLPSLTGARENPAPACYDGTGTPTASRRLIYVAVTNCDPIAGNATPDFQSARFAELFLVRPSLDYQSKTVEKGEVIAEFVRWITPNDSSGKLHLIVDLVDYPGIDEQIQ